MCKHSRCFCGWKCRRKRAWAWAFLLSLKNNIIWLAVSYSIQHPYAMESAFSDISIFLPEFYPNFLPVKNVLETLSIRERLLRFMISLMIGCLSSTSSHLSRSLSERWQPFDDWKVCNFLLVFQICPNRSSVSRKIYFGN